MRWFQRLLSRWAEAESRELIAKQRFELDVAKRQLAASSAEIETLAAVIARDRERIRAEGAAYARQRAEAEGTTNERITESVC